MELSGAAAWPSQREPGGPKKRDLLSSRSCATRGQTTGCGSSAGTPQRSAVRWALRDPRPSRQ
jgi:hypothetical protein